ncbi:DUF1311 domain-containing protein [Erythrobacter sp. WH131]|uniref:DUF1311 domain-containing protein n=1 Tax=Erythrobacter ani TaxID=2827235 RepID=A0ABS6SSD8_9SPHN|nr:DUF1311 domain-containing protein [Erythrobacter ani]
MQIFTSLLLLAHPASQDASPDPDWDCANPVQQQEMNWCAANEFVLADAELNRQWARTSAAMRMRDDAWGDDVSPDWDARPGWFDSLLEAQRAWLTFRDAHCRIDGYAARGGSLEPLLVSTCQTALTKTRTQELRDLEDWDR